MSPPLLSCAELTDNIYSQPVVPRSEGGTGRQPAVGLGPRSLTLLELTRSRADQQQDPCHPAKDPCYPSQPQQEAWHQPVSTAPVREQHTVQPSERIVRYCDSC